MHLPTRHRNNGLIQIAFFVGIVFAIAIIIIPLVAHFPFIADDYSLIKSSLKNPFPIFSAWTEHDFLYRPLPILTFNLNYHISGNDPWSYYLLNFLVHLATTLSLFFLLRKLFSLLEITKSHRLATLLSTFFFFSPQALIDVYWISGRTDLLCTLFMLLSLLAFIRYICQQSFMNWLLTMGFALGTVLCKETAIIIILYAIVISRTVFDHSYKESASIVSRTYGVLMLCYLAARFFMFHGLMFGNISTNPFSLNKIISSAFYGLWSLLVPIDILDIYSLYVNNIIFVMLASGLVMFAILFLLFRLRHTPQRIKRFSYYAICFSMISLLIYTNSFPSSRLLYAHLPLLLFAGGGIFIAITQYRHWLCTSSAIILIITLFMTSSLNIYRSILIANLEKDLQQSIHQCSPITQNDTIVLLGGICRIGQLIAYFNHGLSEKISIQNTGYFYSTICKSYGSVALDGTNPSVELSYHLHKDTIVLVTNDAGSSLVPNLIDRFSTVTYNEDSSIICIPDKYLRFRRSAPRECAVVFDNKKIPNTAKIIFIHKGQYYMRSLNKFKSEIRSGIWN